MAKKSTTKTPIDTDIVAAGRLQVDPKQIPPKPSKQKKQTGKPATKTKPA